MQRRIGAMMSDLAYFETIDEMRLSRAHEVDVFDVIRHHQASPPVNVEAIAEEIGISVQRVDFRDPGTSGKLKRIRRGGARSQYVISVNNKDSAVRQRFTIAHEFAHYMLHRDLFEKEIVDDAMYRSTQLRRTYEIQADRFAAEILMPERLVKRLVDERKITTVSGLAQILEVSMAAARIRVKELGVDLQ